MSKAGDIIMAIITGVLGLATVAVVLSKNANSAGLVSTSGTALSSVISAAVAPVTGA